MPFDRKLPSRHIREHYQPDDYLAAVLIWRAPDGKTADFRHEYATAEELASERRQAHFRASNASGADLYLTVNALVPGTHNREKSDVQTIRHLYLDVDRDGPEVLERIMKSRELPHPSTVIATSSGKMQVLWRVENFAKDEAEAVVRGMAARYGGDQAVWDCARILRLPGFRNCKPQYVKPFYTRILPGERTRRILRPADFPVFPELERQIAHAEVRKIAPGHHSRSEEDWARVLRKLAKGEDPEAVKAWLEKERHDKASPKYYAARTVDRALQFRQRHPLQRHCPNR